MVLGLEQHRGAQGFLDPHDQDFMFSDPLASRLLESLRLWTRPLALSPQGEQILGWLRSKFLNMGGTALYARPSMGAGELNRGIV